MFSFIITRQHQFRNLFQQSWLTSGARQILLKLREYGLLEEARLKNGIPHAKGDGLIYNKAIIDLLLSDMANCERFLMDDFDEIRYSDHERDKKGKLIRCKAYFTNLKDKHNG